MFVKRIFDFLISAAALLVTGPLLLLVAAAIYLQDFHSPLYIANRVGRGERLFGVANHDSDAFLKRVGPVSTSGIFCNGEIGPVGGKTFVHGYTSMFGVFSEPVR